MTTSSNDSTNKDTPGLTHANAAAASSLSDAHTVTDSELAAEVIRKKIITLYGHEPNAQEEAREAKAAGNSRSKHQEFMYRLSTSGKALAQIQADWHRYYQELPDREKHEVWQEFYSGQSKNLLTPTALDVPYLANTVTENHQKPTNHHYEPATPKVADIKKQLLTRVASRSNLKAKHHLQSLAFGVGMGCLAMLVLMFTFFNHQFIAPFVTPSRAISNTPIIIDPSSTATDPEPKIIIPKINVEIPVVYDEPSIEERAIQNALERGVVHYATTSSPGEQGNAVIFGHSSNNILNRGKYKFAFVLLHRLEIGDTFVLTKDEVRYVYRVYEKKIVPPSEVSVLGPADRPSTATLITCDPPGTVTNRLVVIGEQISPDPAGNTTSTALDLNAEPAVVPSAAPSLWSRLFDWI